MWRMVAAWIVLAGAAHAADCTGPAIRFIESAPRDRFEIAVGNQELHAVTIDLRGSAGRLIFGTAAGGTGVDVFQPLRDEDGTQAGDVPDGAEALTLRFRDARAGTRAAFSIDVDDRLTTSGLGQTRVAGGKMEGARVSLETAQGAMLEAVFDAANRAQICP